MFLILFKIVPGTYLIGCLSVEHPLDDLRYPLHRPCLYPHIRDASVKVTTTNNIHFTLHNFTQTLYDSARHLLLRKYRDFL